MIATGENAPVGYPFTFPPTIATTLGFKLAAVGPGTATVEFESDVSRHANPMGTLHGGVLCDIADAAIGTAHSTTLQAGESFTSIDLGIKFFRPVWDGQLMATAKPVQSGHTLSHYVCEVTRADGKLVAQVTSTVMTLRGDQSKGR